MLTTDFADAVLSAVEGSKHGFWICLAGTFIVPVNIMQRRAIIPIPINQLTNHHSLTEVKINPMRFNCGVLCTPYFPRLIFFLCLIASNTSSILPMVPSFLYQIKSCCELKRNRAFLAVWLLIIATYFRLP